MIHIKRFLSPNTVIHVKDGLSGTCWFSEFRSLYLKTDSGKDARYLSEMGDHSRKELWGSSLPLSSIHSVTWGQVAYNSLNSQLFLRAWNCDLDQCFCISSNLPFWGGRERDRWFCTGGRPARYRVISESYKPRFNFIGGIL